MSQSEKDKAFAIIDKYVDAIKPLVEAIEARPMTTKGHYGDYMGVIAKMTKNREQAVCLGLVLVRSGANKQGVVDAVRVCFG